MDGWKTSFRLGWPTFRGELLDLGRVTLKLTAKVPEHQWPEVGR